MSESCFCGMDAVGTCTGPCGRRVCAAHAVLEHSLMGYRKPGTPLLTQFPQLETVAQLGYGTVEGARCTDAGWRTRRPLCKRFRRTSRLT
jgi:hypothetical protein